MKDNVITVEFQDHNNKTAMDLELELDITALELFAGLNTAFGWGYDMQNVGECYLSTENPITLLRGNRTLREFGLRDGSIIHYARH